MPSEQLRQFIEYQKGPFIPCGRKKSPGIPEFLLNSHCDGKTLTFQLSHRHAYTNTSADPPVTFRLDLVGPDKANLVRIPQDGPTYVRMVREKQYTGKSEHSQR